MEFYLLYLSQIYIRSYDLQEKVALASTAMMMTHGRMFKSKEVYILRSSISILNLHCGLNSAGNMVMSV